MIIQDVLEEINKRYNEDEDAPGMVDVVDDINFLLTLAGYVKKRRTKNGYGHIIDVYRSDSKGTH